MRGFFKLYGETYGFACMNDALELKAHTHLHIPDIYFIDMNDIKRFLTRCNDFNRFYGVLIFVIHSFTENAIFSKKRPLREDADMAKK